MPAPADAQALVESGGNELVVTAKVCTKCHSKRPVHLQVIYQGPVDAAARAVTVTTLASLVVDPCVGTLCVGLDNLPVDPVAGGVLSVLVRPSDSHDRVCEAAVSVRVTHID
jgi:hypothetical protein